MDEMREEVDTNAAWVDGPVGPDVVIPATQIRKFLVPVEEGIILEGEEAQESVLRHCFGSSSVALLRRLRRQRCLFDHFLNTSFLMGSSYVVIGPFLATWLGQNVWTSYFLPLLALLASILVFLHGMSLMNYALLKLIAKEFYAWILAVESVGFAVGYAATNCWSFRGNCMALILFIYSWAFGTYDSLSLKARAVFRWGILYCLCLFLILMGLLYLRQIPDMCEDHITYFGERVTDTICRLEDQERQTSFSMVDFSLNRSSTFLFLMGRTLYVSFKNVRDCVLIQSRMMIRLAVVSTSAIPTSELNAQPKVDSLQPQDTKPLSKDRKCGLRRRLVAVSHIREFSVKESKTKLIHMLLGEKLGDTYINRRRSAQTFVKIFSMINFIFYSTLGIPFWFVSPTIKRYIAIGVIFSGVVVLENMFYGINFFLFKQVFTNYEPYLALLKSFSGLSAYSAVFCWDPISVTVFFMLGIGNIGNFTVDCFPSKTHRVIRVTLTLSLLMIMVFVFALAFRLSSAPDCQAWRYSFWYGNLSLKDDCRRQQPLATYRQSLHPSLMDRLKLGSLSWAEIGINNGLTYALLCLKQVYVAIRYPRHLTMIKSKLRLEEEEHEE